MFGFMYVPLLQKPKKTSKMKTEVKSPLDLFIEKVKNQHNIEIQVPKNKWELTPRFLDHSEQKYAALRFSNANKAEVSTSGSWYSPKQAIEYATRLLILSQIAEEFNNLYTQE